MNKTALFSLTALLACGFLPITIGARETEKQALDIGPFALPGTPANEVRFEEPREIREVTVTFKDAAPHSVGDRV